MNKCDTMKTIDGSNNKAREVYIDNAWVLYSYDTPVAVLRKGELVRLWDGYSMTTMKHINLWLGEHGHCGIAKKGWEKMPVEAA